MDPLLIVGIGASAGGLESLERFFANVPLDSGLAFVVIQHLSPDYKSLMDELLARHTMIPVVQAEDGKRVEANHIYLLPPKKEMIIRDRMLHLTDKDPKAGLTLPIDNFLRSLAQDAEEHAAAVILSGTGSDGSRGIKHIHDRGGLVISEDATTAHFSGMPLAAQQTGFVDLVLKAQEIPRALVRRAQHEEPLVESPSTTIVSQAPEIEMVYELLKQEYDIDFVSYKPSTVGRRVSRRLNLLGLSNLSEYLGILQSDSEELNSLYCDLLIGVTQFFRDTDPFTKLESTVIPEILRRKSNGDDVRVWVAGCATGEEAYSLAILFHEAFERIGAPTRLKIFATDVHKTSLDFAAGGVFNAHRLNNVPADRLERYFVAKNGDYQVLQSIRHSIVFARHNLLKDAPFTNLDLITCRNLLIYFKLPAQRKAISMFHFSLKTDGFLLLGASESPGELSDEFATVDERCRLYRKRRDLRLPDHFHFPMDLRPSRVTLPFPVTPSPADALGQAIHDVLLERYMPPSLLVNHERKVLECYGGAETLLRIRGRHPSSDLLDLLDSDAKSAIAGGLARVIHRGQPVVFTGVKIRTDEREQRFQLRIEPVAGRSKHSNRLFIIVLQPLAEPTERNPATDLDMGEMSHSMVTALEEQLRHSKENLQATIEELETSNEELQAANEELVASNEELQSTNEELHSVNEELYTVNSELQRKIQELAELNCDMEGLLRSTDVAIIFLDDQLRIRRFTPRIVELFDLVDSDLGRRIHTFAHRLKYDALFDDIDSVLRDGVSREKEVAATTGGRFLSRILPYRVEGTPSGVVVSLVDVSVLAEARERLSHLSSIVESSIDAIISNDATGRIVSWNGAAERLFGYPAADAVGKSLHELLISPDHAPTRWDQWLDTAHRGGAVLHDDVSCCTASGKSVLVSVSFFPVRNENGEVVAVSGIYRDITEARRIERLFKRTFDSTPAGMLLADTHGRILLANSRIEEIFGWRPAELEGVLVEQLIPERLRSGHAKMRRLYESNPQPRQMGDARDLMGRRKDGSEFPVEVGLSPIDFDEGLRILVAIADVSVRKQATESLYEEIRRREHFLAMLSHELRNPLSAVRNATHLLTKFSLDSPAATSALSVVHRQTAHMTRLLDDLLDVARITQDRIALVVEEFDLRAVLSQAVESVQPLADEQRVTIERNLPITPLRCRGDKTRLEQVIANLLTNAIKYSDRGGQVQVTLNASAETARIVVRDFGAGMTREVLERVFELFMQADSTLDRSKGGMGVGLTLARKLVELHGGTLTGFSEGVGKGSEFEVVLPRSRSTGVNADAGHAEQATPDKQQFQVLRVGEKADSNDGLASPATRVVIVEDQDDNRNMLRALLELRDIVVWEAANGPGGLELIELHRPDTAIIDVGLPGMSGYDVARHLRQRVGTDIRLIALTGYGQPADRDAAGKSGFDYFLVKPLQVQQLYTVLGLDKSD